jgi:hypothetical protein
MSVRTDARRMALFKSLGLELIDEGRGSGDDHYC